MIPKFGSSWTIPLTATSVLGATSSELSTCHVDHYTIIITIKMGIKKGNRSIRNEGVVLASLQKWDPRFVVLICGTCGTNLWYVWHAWYACGTRSMYHILASVPQIFVN